jgi:uncharacterized protein YdhG (YjbR/CyaY superfamily)
MKTATKPVKKAAPRATKTFSADERAAMQDAAREAKRGKDFDGEAEVKASIAKMSDSDRKLAEKIHAIVKAAAPSLMPKTWYGMPAYANAAGKTICFFQNAGKFKARYSTLGFNDAAKLDDGNFWPVAYALTTLTAADEKAIAALVKRAVG